MDDAKQAAVDAALAAIKREVTRAVAKHPPMHGPHEAYAILLEEVDELWAEVKKQTSDRSAEKMRQELTQIAAMAVRTIVDLKL